MRLNKYIAHHSSYSRREADKAIQDGYVRVDGEIQTNPATDVIEGENIIYVSGKQVSPRDKYTVIVYNKPKGELVTKSDPKGRRTIYDSLSKEYKHYVPVGRLDYASEGLLLLTDASKVASALMESNLERIYKIKIKGEVTPDMEDAMLKGMTLDDASAGGHSHSKVTKMEFKPFIGYKIQKNQPNYSILKVALSEGKNRELRRFFAHFGAEIVDLKRISFAEIELNNLPEAKVRFLSRSEYSALSKFLKDEKKSELKESRELSKNSEKRSFTQEKKSVAKDERKSEQNPKAKKHFSKDETKKTLKDKKPLKKKR
ncbi:pseudouridine synthase [Sulfurimonas sp.]|uniref:pseudouridine synthase n=1 Tax=Sulfurimonas sp. TaxID=2022749 RepID=UPI0025E11F03|nr:pseudouridine synthase [Sulfurimonas sp.]MCK9472721.1 rRNA pseudouridine synthase [Sulfurimonas sp.]